MTWKCGECGRFEEERSEVEAGDVTIDAVCHHCGMPLCSRESDEGWCQHWIDDDGRLLGAQDAIPPTCHCRTCLDRHHPSARTVRPPWDLRSRRSDR